MVWRIHTRRGAALSAAIALLAGLACYLWLRPQGLGPSLLLGSAPALTHAFAFSSLLLVCACPQRKRSRYALLGAWLALLVAFESLQSAAAQPWLTRAVEAVEPWWHSLGGLLRAHGAGTFDLTDVLASVLGVGLGTVLTRPVASHVPRDLHASSS